MSEKLGSTKSISGGEPTIFRPRRARLAQSLKDVTGEDISTRAMMDYFKPLMSWLEEQNKGRQIGWE
jgi:Angiotensin-converting enzyme